MQRDVRVCFDVVEFLTYHMHDVGITEQDARDLARAARMTDTRELKNLHGTAYLDARKNLTVAQRRKLLQLVLEARADPAYRGENVQCDAPVLSTQPQFSKIESRCDLYTCFRTVVQATRGLL